MTSRISIDQILSEQRIFNQDMYIHIPQQHSTYTKPVHHSKSTKYDKHHASLQLLESTSKIPYDASLDNTVLFISTTRSTAGTVSPSFSSNSSQSSSTDIDAQTPADCIWADPNRIKENPARYQYIKTYLLQHQLSLQSPLPLMKPCTFYRCNTNSANYCTFPIFHCNTVWNFSSRWRHYKQHYTNESLFCFIKGVQPMWEDPVNQQGGRLIINTKSVNDVFEWILCAFVGGGLFDDGAVGIVVSRKLRGDRVEIWLDQRADIPPFKYELIIFLYLLYTNL